MRIDGDEIQFSTGRTLYANGGIIGIGPFGDDNISGGYDGDVARVVPSGLDAPNERYLTGEECRELADHMIARWERFREDCASQLFLV